MKRGREEVKKKGTWHLGSAIHNVLNMRHKGRWHAFSMNMPKSVLGSVYNNCRNKLKDS